MTEFNFAKARRDFPILSLRVNAKPLIYFDNAATTQKPRAVLDKLNQFYKLANANVHRGSHSLSNAATTAFEQARLTVAGFINAPNTQEIIWCKGTTEAINLVANSLGSLIVNEGDTILVSVSEHHANIVPWQLLAQRNKAQVISIPLTCEQHIDQQAYQALLESHKPKIVALGHVSNALGTIHPIQEMIAKAKKIGAITLIDGAQAIAHLTVDVQHLGCDFYCFSGHKCYGPTGIGVLWGKSALLEKMPPWQGGGEMIDKVSFTGTTFNKLPFKFEAGTPPIADAIALGAALTYLSSQNKQQLAAYEQRLMLLLSQGCANIEQVTCISPQTNNVGIVSFYVDGVHHQDLALILDQSGIAVRSGHHCAMPLMQSLNIEGTLRASVSFYNTEQEIMYFLEALQQAIEMLSGTQNPSIALDQKVALENDTIHLPEAITVIESLSAATSWQQRFSYLLKLGDLLPTPNQGLIIVDNRLAGCESGVWLQCIISQTTGEKRYAAWSDARIMRGLIVMLLSCKDAAILDAHLFLTQVKLLPFLSPSRTSGVKAILSVLQDIQ